jgi:trehalose/maltose transport system permease protein
MMGQKRISLLWFTPAATLLSVIVAYPLLRTLLLSFVRENLSTGFRTEFAALDNFIRIAFDSRFWDCFRTTALFTTASVSAEFLIGLALALSANYLTRFRSLSRVIFLVPWTLPTAVIAVLWAWIFNDQFGVLNAILLRAGVVDSPVIWLGEPRAALFAIIVADIWKTAPFVFLILLAGLQNIPRDLYEAIEVDGGGAWEQFRFVTWPHLLPFVFVAVIFRVVQAFAIFDLVWVMTGGGPGGATETVSIYTYQTYMRYLDFGYGAALAITTVVILALTASGLHRLLLAKYEQNL